MRRSMAVGLAAALTMVLFAAAASADQPGTVDVCHVNELGEWEVKSVRDGGNAVEAHLNHGDGLPGDPVPGMPGYAFDDNCVPVAVPPGAQSMAFARWITPESNVLIARLSDTNLDGVISPGDLITTDQYPNSVDGLSLGGFAVTSHTVASVVTWTSSEVLVEAANGDAFEWILGRAYSEYRPDGANLPFTTSVRAIPGPDQVITDTSSPSEPGQSLNFFVADETTFVAVGVTPP